ncbi:hypothetical protein E2562_032752 [Oryza meyeriana var. granulata]|uniref:Late embryogenesis abundant protein LEA-2 subgroup domain-containing protein n=1 Tax=Oryza meyeriana var. granulata TaxID=110450 RepID=A0A6G1E5X1_9ORYZ|nr:hypothetical protein E2562_032752 [Oryza meyeriana var. granulata]
MGVASERKCPACGGGDDDVRIDIGEVCRPDDGNGVPPRQTPSIVFKLVFITCLVLFAITTVLLAEYICRPPNPTPFLVLASADGLDTGASSTAPELRLQMGVVGLTQYYHTCAGGDGSALQVSYHGMAIAMGSVPRFCIHGKRAGGEQANGVVTVVASAEGTLVREELRSLMRSER